jgi:hypothetical protein
MIMSNVFLRNGLHFASSVASLGWPLLRPVLDRISTKLDRFGPY